MTKSDRMSGLALLATMGAIILVVIIAMAIVSYVRSEPAAVRATCLPVDEHTRQVLITALDTALHQHIGTLFSVMLKDARGQPDRAITGATKAITSYQNALAELERPAC
jgi:hypothetical protein